MTETPSIDDVRALERFIARDGATKHLLTFQGILRSHEEMYVALSTPPADDVREAQEVAMEREVTRILSRLAKRNDWAEDDTAIGGMAAHIVSVAIAAAAEVRPHGTVTDASVEAAAQAMFEDPLTPGEYTWAQMVAEDPSRADIWRADARRVLEAAREVHP